MHRSIANACFRSLSRPVMTQPTLSLHTPSKTHFSSGMTFPSPNTIFQKRHSTSPVTHTASPEYPMDGVMEETVTTMETPAAEELLQLSPSRYIEFNCSICSEKVAQSFHKPANEKGVVIIRCSGCQNLHLISDNFIGYSERGVEDLARSRSECLISKHGLPC